MKLARPDLLQKTFAVVVNFPFDVAFGNAFIHELKVFDVNLSYVEWVRVREELPFLCPLRQKEGHGVICKMKRKLRRRKKGKPL